MRDEVRYRRQLDLIDHEALAEVPITLIGCGALGSFCAMNLAKMGARNLTLWDGDEVESHNISNQLYAASAIGDNKAEATADLMETLEEYRPEVHTDMFDGDPHEITIFAVDSIEVREEIWDEHISGNPSVELLIDGRMGAEAGELRTCKPPYMPTQQEEYANTLVDPEDTVDVPCTAQAIVYCANIMASMMAGCVKKYIEHEDIPPRRNLNLDSYNLV